MVVMDGQLILVPVEREGAAVADERRTTRGGSATGVEVLGIDGVDTGLILDDGAGRVVVAGIWCEATQPVVGLDFVGHTLAVVGFPGAAGALLLGVSVTAGFFAFALAAALVIALVPEPGRTGFATESAVTGTVQATALAPTALEAEIRAKAALLSGPAAAPAWLPHGGVVVLDDQSLQVVATSGLASAA